MPSPPPRRPAAFIPATCALPTPSSPRKTCARPLQPPPTPVLASAATAALVALLLTTAPAPTFAAPRLEKCAGDSACVSTSSVNNPSKFAPPWTYETATSSADQAWASLKAAVSSSPDNGVIVDASDGPDDYYLRAEFPSYLRGTDDVEFRLMSNDSLVTVRSCSREAIFIYPIQAPINTGKNKTRLEAIRTSLGWPQLDGEIDDYKSAEVQLAPDFLPDFE